MVRYSILIIISIIILLIIPIVRSYSYTFDIEDCDNEGMTWVGSYEDINCVSYVDQAYESTEFWRLFKYNCEATTGSQWMDLEESFFVNRSDRRGYYYKCGQENPYTGDNCRSVLESVDCDSVSWYSYALANCIPAVQDDWSPNLRYSNNIYDQENSNYYWEASNGNINDLSNMDVESVTNGKVITFVDNISNPNAVFTSGSLSVADLAKMLHSLMGFNYKNYTLMEDLNNKTCYWITDTFAYCQASNYPQWDEAEYVDPQFDSRLSDCQMITSANTLTLANFKSYIDSNKPVMFRVSKDALEQGKGGEGTGSSWGGCLGDNHWILGVGYNSTDIEVIHPINGKQVYTNLEFNNWVQSGYAYYNCDYSITANVWDNTLCKYDTSELYLQYADYQPKGIYEPAIWCYDTDGDNNYEICNKNANLLGEISSDTLCETNCEMLCSEVGGMSNCNNGYNFTTETIGWNTSGTYNVGMKVSSQWTKSNTTASDTVTVIVADPSYSPNLYNCGSLCSSDDTNFDNIVALNEKIGLQVNPVSNCDGFFSDDLVTCWEYNASHVGYDLCTSTTNGCANSCPEALYINQSNSEPINISYNYSVNVTARVLTANVFGDYFELSNNLDLQWKENYVYANLSSTLYDDDYDDNLITLIGGKFELTPNRTKILGTTFDYLPKLVCWDLDNDNCYDYAIGPSAGEIGSDYCWGGFGCDLPIEIDNIWNNVTFNFTSLTTDTKTVKIIVYLNNNMSNEIEQDIKWLSDSMVARLRPLPDSTNLTYLNLTKTTQGWYPFDLNTSTANEKIPYACYKVTPPPLNSSIFTYCYKMPFVNDTTWCNRVLNCTTYVNASDPILSILNISYEFGNFTGMYNSTFYKTADYLLSYCIGYKNVSGNCNNLLVNWDGICGDGEWDGNENPTDYGDICGNCFDNLLSPLINETDIDYGGYYCGSCLKNNKKKVNDDVWNIVDNSVKKKKFNTYLRFDNSVCKEGEDTLNAILSNSGFIIIVIVLLLLVSGVIVGIILFLSFITPIRLLLAVYRYLKEKRRKNKEQKNQNI